MKSLRTLTAGERRRITDGDPADLDVVELLARREWDRLEFTRRAGLLVVRPMNGSSRGGVSVYPADVTDADAFVYGQINVYGVTTKSERHKRSYWTRTADGNGIGGRKAPVPYGS